MKRFLFIVSCMIALFGLTECTTNNGDIGPIRGKWKVVNIVCQDTESEDYQGNIFWNFQSTTICMQEVVGNEVYEVYGNFRVDDNTLFLDFPDEKYEPYADLGLPRQCELQILQLKGSEMTCVYHSTDSSSITYSLKKW
jgi:hypothetical protein